MNGVNQETHNGRTFGSILFETKEELKEFVETRIELFKMEMRDRLKMVKLAAPSAVIGLVFLGTAYILFTLALCCGLAGDGGGACENLKRAIAIEPRNKVLARQDPDFLLLAQQIPDLRALLSLDGAENL